VCLASIAVRRAERQVVRARGRYDRAMKRMESEEQFRRRMCEDAQEKAKAICGE
jgi:hypothetical protein